MARIESAARGGGIAAFWAVLALAAGGGSALAAPTETVLYSFTGGSDGALPAAPLIADSNGNLYGTTQVGGASGKGVVFKLSPGGTYTVLHTFTGGSDGANPVAGLIADSSGNLYGTTSGGGAAFEGGVVFKLSPSGTETVLHTFTGGSDGANPEAGLIADSSGNLYGTTVNGGAAGKGVVFKLSPSGTETVLYSFTGGSDGANPSVRLIADLNGNLYGTTQVGGASGAGTVFKLSPSGTETVLYSFTSGSDGNTPQSGLFADSSGNLYGTTVNGGASGNGVVFKLAGTGFVTAMPPALQVTPATNIAAVAAEGGTVIFAPSSFDYQLASTTGSVNVSISGIPSWLNASFASASVTPSPMTVTFSLSNLGALGRGTYNATVAFTNTTNGQGNTTRNATLRIYNKDDCKKGGWQNFISPPGPFRNQGDCVSYFAQMMAPP